MPDASSERGASTSATIPQQVEADLKEAMRAGDTARRDALRLLRAALKNAEIERRGGDNAPMSDGDVRAVLQRQIKQRRDSVAQFRSGKREDLAAKEEAEIAVFQSYLPRAMDEDAMRAAAVAAIAESGAHGPKEMGKVMSLLLARIGDSADRSALAGIVRQLLSS
ncbi:MAG: GatB/YqeY domain-containing protein [Thermomicrobia bacterium]|nr:GatB/YqeY domain-containing protein [Thermomicrobia bacterium]